MTNIEWNIERVASLEEDRAAGKSLAEIAKANGTTERAVSSKVNRLGIGKHNSTWTTERTEYVKANAPFMSAQQIADHLGVTRNAVIGKLARLGLSKPRARKVAGSRVSVERRNPLVKSRLKLVVVEERPPPVAGDEAKAFGRQVTLLELTEETCRWPIGDVGSPGFGFCGAKPVEGTPYCWGHCGCAYRPNQRSHRGEILQAAE